MLTLAADWAPGAWSGLGVAVAHQARALADLGLAVDVLVARENVAATHTRGLRVRALPRARFPFDPRAYDVVHVHGLRLAELALELRERFAVPLVATVHAWPHLEHPGSATRSAWSRVQERLLRRCDVAVFPSQAERELGLSLLPELQARAVQVPHGLPQPEPQPRPQPQPQPVRKGGLGGAAPRFIEASRSARQAHPAAPTSHDIRCPRPASGEGASQTHPASPTSHDVRCPQTHPAAPTAHDVRYPPPLILFAGRFTASKGLDLLTRTAPLVLARRDVDFVFAGGHGDAPGQAALDALHARFRGACRVSPWLDAPALDDLFRRAALLLVPSAYEPFGLVALEALRCGTPVLAADVGGLRETVGAGSGGRRLVSRNPHAWAEAILALLDDAPGAAEASRRGPVWVAQRYSAEASARALLEQAYARAAAVPA